MTFKDLTKLWGKYKEKYGAEAYRHISELLKEAKGLHKRDFLKNPTPRGDHEQSWRSFKGKNLEKLVAYIIIREGMRQFRSSYRGQHELSYPTY